MIYLPDVIHQSGDDSAHPEWDTMIAVRNMIDTPLKGTLRIFDETGQIVLWPASGSDHGDISLNAHSSFAASFLPNNGFGPKPPQDFKGHAILQFYRSTPFGTVDASDSVLSFALAACNRWKYGVNLPRFGGNVELFAACRSTWNFAYAIPYFNDIGGATDTTWETGMTVQNYETSPVDLSVFYTINQAYQQAGTTFSFKLTVPAAGGLRFDLLRGNPSQNVGGLLSAGYPVAFNSEGHIDVVTERYVCLYPSLIVANTDYSFMVGENPT